MEEYDADGEKARRWIRVGVAFPHAEGPGFNVELQCLPLNGKLVALAPREDDAVADPPPGRTPESSPPSRESRSRPRPLAR